MDEQDTKGAAANGKKEKKKEKYMPFTEHLEELRWRILKSLGSVVGFGLASFIFAEELLNFLTEPLKNATQDQSSQIQLQSLNPAGLFLISIKVAFFAGIIISFPVIIYQFWQFVAPGLFHKEKKYVLPIIFFTIVCFLTGSFFAYFVVIPYALNFFLGFQTDNVVAQYTIDDYISFITTVMIVFGLVFELPLVALFLGRIGIIDHKMMSKYRKQALLGAVIFGAVLTPPDIFTQLALAGPLWVLYEISIILVRIFGKKPSEDDI